MQVLGIEAERIRKLKLVSLKLDGGNIIVAGEPNQGKTTLINLLWMALEAKRVGKDVLSTGEKDGYISVELGDAGKEYSIKVTREFRENDVSKLKVISGDGKPLKAEFLKDLVSGLSFDPLEFINSKGLEQVNTLLSVSSVPVEELEQLDEARAALYADRTVYKRDLALAAALVKEEPKKQERIDINELTESLQKIKVHNDKYDDSTKLLASLKAELTSLVRQREEVEAKIKLLSERIDKGDAAMAKLSRMDDKAELSKLSGLQDLNIAAEKYEQWEKNNEKFKQAEAVVADVEEKIQAIDARKKDILANAKWPVEGMRVQDGEVMVGDVLLRNCGESQKLQVSFAIACSLNQGLRACRLDGAESLGASGRKQILDMAEQAGFQVLMSRVSDDGAKEGEIVIEDGVVQSN